MPKSKSADTLLKRLQKIERAQGRLGDITTRIRAQAETIGALLKEAQALVNEKPETKPTGRARTTAPAAKPAAARRSSAQAPPARTKKATAARPAKAASTRRAPRKAASR
jgi:hypothetical protein